MARTEDYASSTLSDDVKELNPGRQRSWLQDLNCSACDGLVDKAHLPVVRRQRDMQTFSDTLFEVFRAIAANKLRSFLTMFGIAWGVGSLLVLVGLGEGFRSGQHRNLARLGNDVVMVFNGTIPAVANQHTGMRPYQLTVGDLEELRKLPELRGVTAELTRNDLYEVSPYSNTSSHVVGVYPNYPVVRFIPIAQGRFIDEADVTDRRRVAVLGFKAANLLLMDGRCWASRSRSTGRRSRSLARWRRSR